MWPMTASMAECDDGIMPGDSREFEKRICKFPQPQAAKAGNPKPGNPPKIDSSSTTWSVLHGQLICQMIKCGKQRHSKFLGPCNIKNCNIKNCVLNIVS